MTDRLRKPRLTEAQILSWADAHYQQTGWWPTLSSGLVIGEAGESWKGIDLALRSGSRGLPGGSSLAVLLEQHGRKAKRQMRSSLTEAQILRWADDYYCRCGKWPASGSGAVAADVAITWQMIHCALRNGTRGLPGGSSLSQLLAAARGRLPYTRLEPLTLERIEAWVRRYFERTGNWPDFHSGPVVDNPLDSWKTIHDALADGRRGLPRGHTLARIVRRLKQHWLEHEYVPIPAQWMKRQAVSEYGAIEETPAPVVLETIATWIQEPMRGEGCHK
jgi:hypothetical protein